MLVARVRVTSSPEGIEPLVELLTAEAERVPSMFTGCQMFVVSVDAADENTVMIAEEWSSKEQFDAYQTSEHFASIMGSALPLLAGPPDSAYYEGELVGP